jgi:hypothetical protein
VTKKILGQWVRFSGFLPQLRGRIDPACKISNAKAPNAKKISKGSEYPMVGLGIRVWDIFGIWSLGFGIFPHGYVTEVTIFYTKRMRPPVCAAASAGFVFTGTLR